MASDSDDAWNIVTESYCLMRRKFTEDSPYDVGERSTWTKAEMLELLEREVRSGSSPTKELHRRLEKGSIKTYRCIKDERQVVLYYFRVPGDGVEFGSPSREKKCSKKASR